MRARSGLVILLLLAAASGCKKEGKDEKPAGAPATAPVASAPPYTGPLTVERLEQAKKSATPSQPWAPALAGLRALVGEPTKVDGEVHGWYLLQGEECHFLEVTRDAQQDVVAGSQQGAADKLVPSYFEKCAPGAAAASAPAAAGEGSGAAPAGAGSTAGEGEGGGPGGHGSGTGGGQGGGGGKGTGGGKGKAGKAQTDKIEKPGKPADDKSQGGW